MPSLPVLVAVLLLGFPPFLKNEDESFQEFIDRVLQAHTTKLATTTTSSKASRVHKIHVWASMLTHVLLRAYRA